MKKTETIQPIQKIEEKVEQIVQKKSTIPSDKKKNFSPLYFRFKIYKKK